MKNSAHALNTSAALSPELLLRLQATAGNRAVQRLVQRLANQRAAQSEVVVEELVLIPAPVEAVPPLSFPPPTRLDVWRLLFAWKKKLAE